MLEALAEDERIFRGIMDNSRDGISLVDELGRIIEWNAGAERIFGLNKADVCGRFIWDVQFDLVCKERRTPETYGQIKEKAVEALRTGCSSFLNQLREQIIQHPDGTRITVEEMPFAIPTEKGFMICSILRDATDRKRAEEMLREREEQYRILTETSRDIIGLISVDGKILSLNPAFEIITGWLRIEWIGKHFGSIIHPDDQIIAAENFGYALQGESPVFEVRFIGKSGEHIPVEIVGSPQYRDGKIAGIQGTARDITERKHAEEKLQKAKDELEVKVEERTAELVSVNQELRANIEETKRAEGLLKLQRDLATALSSVTDLNEALGLILDTALMIEGIDGGAIYSVSDDGDVDLMLHRGLSDEFIKGCSHYNIGTPRSRIVAAGELIYKDFAAICEQPFRDILKEGLRSTAILPVKYRGKVIANLNLASRTRDEIPLDVRTTVEAIAASIGRVIARLKAEGEFKAAHDQLSAIIEFLPDATFVIDQNKKVVAWNRAVEEMTGVSKADIIGKGNYACSVPFYGEPRPMLIDLLDRYDREIESKYDHTEKKGGTINAEAYVPSLFRGRGAYIWGTASLLYDSRGKLLGSIESLRDITQRKLAEEQLRDSENRYKAILENTGVATVIVEEDSVISFSNKKFEELSGYTKEEIEGKKSWTEFIVEDDLDRMLVQHRLRRVNPDLALKTYEFRSRNRYGQIKDILLTIDVIPGTKKSIASLLDISERKKAEIAALESKEYLNKIINSIGDPIFVKDRDHRFVLVNDVLCNLMGHPREEIIGRTRTDHDFFPKDQADIFWEKDEMVFKSGEENINDEKITDIHGRIRDITTKKTLYTDNAGNQFIVGISRDITDQKRAEVRLRKAEAQFRALVEQIPAVTYTAVLDEASTTLYVSPQIESILGFSQEDYKADPDIWRKRLHPEDRDRVLAELEQCHANNQPFKSEYRMIARDGQTMWISDEAVAIRDSTGKPIFLQGVMTDITERKQTETKLKESERRLADIINFLPDATLVIDKEGRIIAWNRAIEAMTGIRAEEILGKGNYEYALPFYGERRPILIDLALQPDEEIEKGYTRFRRQQGTLTGGAYMPALKGGGIFLVGSAAALYDSEGVISGAIESIRDVTENKHTGEALCKAKEAAEAATIAKSEFLANMSHEIRTPMNAVIGMTGLLLTSDLNPDQRECIEMIHSSGEALLSIINEILDFSKIDSGKMELERQPFDLRSCIRESLDMMAPKAAEKGLKLTCIMKDSVPATILSDPMRLRQILVNLLSNAIKFTEKGAVEVSISSQAIEGGKSNLHFAVRDTGIGIPQERMDKLFQSFSQVDMSTTRKYGGTGLGLAISKRLTEAMDGEIWAESIPTKGSTFHFTLPVDVSSNSLIRPVVIHSPPRSNVRANMHILMAEDNAVNQKVLLKMLGRLGYKADVAADGREALQALECQKYDLVLMDIQMPKMDGFEATREIHQRWPNGPMIVALTAYALEGDREKCIEAGMDGYISKPVKMDDLKAALLHCESQILERSDSQ